VYVIHVSADVACGCAIASTAVKAETSEPTIITRNDLPTCPPQEPLPGP
jgi:hypothetical protein